MSRYETICGVCDAQHALGRKYDHLFVARKPAPSAGSERCPTCGREWKGNDPPFRAWGCANSWHTAPESGKEEETVETSQDFTCRCGLGIPCLKHPYSLTTAPAQGAERPHLVHEAREAIRRRWAKYSDPKNLEWDFEDADQWERHAINAVLDLDQLAHVTAAKDRQLERLAGQESRLVEVEIGLRNELQTKDAEIERLGRLLDSKMAQVCPRCNLPLAVKVTLD